MVHFTCDQCGKDLGPNGHDRYVVKIEAFPADDSFALTEADLEEDQMQAVSELLGELEADPALNEPSKRYRFDLCEECHKRFVQDPLGKESGLKLFFSKN